jgi:hypothetical protein
LAIEEVARGAVLIASLFNLLTAPLVKECMSVQSESSGPYAVGFQAYEHAKFVAVLRGRFYLQFEGETTPIPVRRGDAYVLTNGRPYRIFNEDVPETDATTLFSADRRLDGVVRWGDGAPDTITVGSRVVFNPGVAAALRARLPSFIRVPGGTAEAVRFRVILKLLCGEPEGAPGTAVAADKYIGVLLVQVLRHLLAGDRNRKTSGGPRESAQ